MKDNGINEEASPVSVLAQDFWPWFWTLTIAGATVTAALSLVVGLMTQRRADRRAARGTPYETSASVPGGARTSVPRTSVPHEVPPLARR
ncbi:MAG: hypothetical protein ACM3ML_15680 [Micromonosporaceae bacterium]